MTKRHEVRIPDLGDFADVEIVEVMVGVGDHIAVEDPLITLETDKAAMEVPSTWEGTIVELPVATGMRVSEARIAVEPCRNPRLPGWSRKRQRAPAATPVPCRPRAGLGDSPRRNIEVQAEAGRSRRDP